MAVRPVFITDADRLCIEKNVEFEYFGGFALSRKRLCIASLHAAFAKDWPAARPLEISSKSTDRAGQALSAFSLRCRLSTGERLPVESCFQSSKVFRGGVQYLDLLHAAPLDAKRDPRLRESGELIRFTFEGVDWPLEPKSFFYDFLYMSALRENRELLEYVAGFDAFTDIEFNPGRSFSCQARSVALCVSLHRQGRLDAVLADREAFLEIYRRIAVIPAPAAGGKPKRKGPVQGSLLG